jgi:hypothetical protein
MPGRGKTRSEEAGRDTPQPHVDTQWGERSNRPERHGDKRTRVFASPYCVRGKVQDEASTRFPGGSFEW